MKNGNNQINHESRQSRQGLLGILRKNVLMRAILVILTVVLTIVLLFSLTVAWFTNVAQTGGLTFTAEKWDFDGTITLSDEAVTAAPGDEGYVSMQLANNGQRIAAASVTVSKEQMDLRMQKRMYFYIDTSTVRNGEYIDRIWVSSNSSYTYTVFPGSELLINETTQNAPALKWMWVYDVLGYYVVGTQPANSGIAVKEYIRPVEYPFDPIHTTFADEVGYPDKIDETTSVTDFLKELTANDGYEGVIDENTVRTADGFYPIQVDENGYGVWLYLCSYQDIQTSFQEDMELGEDSVNCTAHITVTGQNSREEATVLVDSVDTLEQALNSSGAGVIELQEDLTLTEPLTLNQSTYAMLDLGGHTITANEGVKTVISASPGSNLILLNGELKGSGATNVIYSSGAHVSLTNVTISGAVEGVEIRDYQNDLGADSTIYITDCTITGSDDAIFVQANGDRSDRKTKVVVENSTLTGSGYAGIYCKGNAYEAGSDILVSNCTVTGYFAGIYFPQKDSLLTVSGGSVTGSVGIVAKGGTLDLVDCTVQGTGTSAEPAYNPSGWTLTGDGVYLEAAYGWPTHVSISGDQTKITSVNGYAVRKYKEDATHASITISGGTYSHDVSKYLAEGATCTQVDGGYTVKISE